jgi:hypothetical protein
MLGHFLIGPVKLRLVTAGGDDGGLGVVRHSDLRDAAKERVGLAMSLNPGGQLLIGEGLSESLVAGAQHRQE